MNKIIASIVGGFLLILTANPALAFQCTSLMPEVDAALADATNLSAALADEIVALRDDGAARHEAGDHGGSVAAYQEALSKLGQSSAASTAKVSTGGRSY